MGTDVNGNSVNERGTYPFGESWYQSGSTSSQWICASYKRDIESSNDYALAREYVSTQGRFLSPDPLQGRAGDPQSWNRYAYVENDPINLRDPSGKGFWSALANLLVALFTLDAINLNGGGWAGFGQAGQQTAPMCGDHPCTGGDIVGMRCPLCAAGGGGSGQGGGSGNGGRPGGSSRADSGDPTLIAQEAPIEDPDIIRSESNTEVEWERPGMEPVEPEPVPDPIWSENSPIGVPIYNPFNGPLDYKTIGKNFQWYFPKTLEKTTTYYRNWGGEATLEGSPRGQWLATEPVGGLSARISYAIHPTWPNTLENLSAVEVPAGTTVYIGPAAAQPGMNGFLLGGGMQVFVAPNCPVKP